ncbi:hypothetical protein ACFXTO_036818 [Malus domestica]
MSSLRSDLTFSSRVYPEPYSSVDDDLFDLIPDSLLLLVFNKIGDVKALGRCCVVSRRFHSLVPQSRTPFSALFRLVLSGIVKPLQALGQFLGPNRRSPNGSHSALAVDDPDSSAADSNSLDQSGVTHHSPTQVLKNFNEIRFLRIELPNGELGIDDGVLLRWRADFGSTLDNCVILGASSVIHPGPTKASLFPDTWSDGLCTTNNAAVAEDNGSIPDSFYTNGGLKLRVVWTISSLIAASARHYLLQPIISEHKTLDSLVLTDADGQGVLHMNRDQLEELRVKPLSASLASKRTLVPALNMRLWYAPQLELPDGVVLKGATLVAIRPSEQSLTAKKEVSSDMSWVSTAFEEPYGTAAKMLVKRRTYCLEMNSF